MSTEVPLGANPGHPRRCRTCGNAHWPQDKRVHRLHILDRAQYQMPPTAKFGNASPTVNGALGSPSRRRQVLLLDGAKRAIGT
jgi:hypothetical protein